jgi:cytochrome c553
MKKYIILTLLIGLSAVSFAYLDLAALAQTTDAPKMPDVIILGKDNKLGQVTFNHIKHNGGTYTIDQSKMIACISCHHTAQPAAELVKHPPLKTAWPADRTTTLTAELFAKDPKAAGIASCRDCHAKVGEKPKLLDAIPEIKHESSAAIMSLNNQQAFHRTCAGCHTEVKKTVPATKGPIQTQCMMCHKKAA